ncbi:hypothetical protein M885DRAFT_590501 [Pelagophyceae sp. CCMP2097]|nr:hypothetical protein M885DRAFT_590501 [Pelagophyceae sp. CCMP2097]
MLAASTEHADVMREASALREDVRAPGVHVEIEERAGAGAQHPVPDSAAVAIPGVHPARLENELRISNLVEEAFLRAPGAHRAKVLESERAVPHADAGLCNAGAAPREPSTAAAHVVEPDYTSLSEDAGMDEDEEDRPALHDDGGEGDYGPTPNHNWLDDDAAEGTGNFDREYEYEPPRRALDADDYEDEPDAEAAAPDEDDSENLFADGAALSKTSYGENTPTKRARSMAPKGVWDWVKRLKNNHWALQKDGKDARTHVCTTVALQHDRDFHPGASAKGDESAKRIKDSSDQRQSTMFDFGAREPAPGKGGSARDKPAVFALPKVEAAKAALAYSYIYFRGALSKSSFDDPAMRDRDQALYEASGGTGKAPFITRRGLAKWVRAEYGVFRLFSRHILLECLEYSEGNPFGQGLNDGATLKNKQKNLAIGLEFVDPKLLKNHTLCLGMVRVLDGTNAGIARKVKEVTHDVTGLDYSDLAHSTIVDFAAIGTCSYLGHEEEGCDMHDDDKLGRAAVGDLVRSKAKVVVNPFDECQALLTKVKDAAIYFTWDGRHQKLEAFVNVVPGGSPNVRLKTDLNKTRIAARYRLIYSVLRMSKALKLFAVANPSVKWKLTEEEWEATAEIEAVLRISGEVTATVQTETHYMGALGRCIHVDMLDKYHAESLLVIDLENLSSSNVLPRKPKFTVDGLTAIGAETLRRAVLEAERRHCGNRTEVVNGSSGVVASDREYTAMLLDPRTMGCRGVADRDRCEWRGKLQGLYVRYALNTAKFEAAKAARARAAAAVEADVPMVGASTPAALQLAALRKRQDSADRNAPWSDEPDNDDAMADAGAPAVLEVDRTPALKDEFTRVVKNYRRRNGRFSVEKDKIR